MAKITDFMHADEVEPFFRKERVKITRLLVRNYGATMEKAEEAFLNGCLALYDNMEAGKLTKETLKSGLSAYLAGCCKNQLLKGFANEPPTAELPKDRDGHISENEPISVLLEDADQTALRHEDYELMESIVRTLPSPCNELIFGRYYGHEPMKDMAAMYGMKSESAAKVALFRCMKKLKNRFFEERKNYGR